MNNGYLMHLAHSSCFLFFSSSMYVANSAAIDYNMMRSSSKRVAILLHLVIQLLVQGRFLHVRDQRLRIIDRVKDQLGLFIEEVGHQLLDAAHHAGLLSQHIVNTCR